MTPFLSIRSFESRDFEVGFGVQTKVRPTDVVQFWTAPICLCQFAKLEQLFQKVEKDGKTAESQLFDTPTTKQRKGKKKKKKNLHD